PPEPDRPTALVITEDDLRPEDFDLSALDIRARATLAAGHLRSPRPVAQGVLDWEAAALADAAGRVGGEVEALCAGVPSDLAAWAVARGATQIATPYVPQGWLRDWLDEAAPALADRGILLAEWRRDWDGLIWPHTSAGFFRVKKQIPEILHRAGLS
ncbi:MAG: hypothetical protein LLP51_11160, partial [Halorhodospira halophila]|nr:hypothetical protein [Halorhodospira halophila]